MFATIPPSRVQALKALRHLDQETASELRSAMFASTKQSFGIPAEHKIKVELDDLASPRFAVLIRKSTDTPYIIDPLTGQVPSPSAPQAAQTRQPRYRWFAADIGVVKGAVTDSQDFDDGCVTTPNGAPFDSGPGSWCVDSADNTIYVCLSEDDF